METVEDLKRRIKSADDLYDVVKTMKTLAAVSLRQHEESLHSVDEYYRSVELGLKALLLSRPSRHRAILPPETVAFIVGSDQGMVGQFNESVAAARGSARSVRFRGRGPLWRGAAPEKTCALGGGRQGGRLRLGPVRRGGRVLSPPLLPPGDRRDGAGCHSPP